MAVAQGELLDIIAKESLVDRGKLTPDAKLADLGIQSIDVISVLFEIEEKYDVQIDEADVPRVETLGEIVDYLLSRINAPKA